MDGCLMARDAELWIPNTRDPYFSSFKETIKVGGVEEIRGWNRWATLPNVNGQKYTIGRRYASREDQGEFIFFPVKNKGPSLVYEITVENNKYFINPTLGVSPIFINQLPVSQKTELQFGDRFRRSEEDGHVFIFRARDVPLPEKLLYSRWAWWESNYGSWYKEGEKKTMDSIEEFIPGQNGLILSHILSYFDVHELKSARSVSKLWAAEGFKILKRRCRLDLNFCGRLKKPGVSMRLFQYSLEMVDNPLQNWRLQLPNKPGAKLREDLNYFIFDSKSTHHFKRLELRGSLGNAAYELRLKLLQILGPQLEELIWGGIPHRQEHHPFPENLVLDKLRIFTLSLVRNIAYPCLASWLEHLFQVIRRVTTIRIDCSGAHAATFLIHLQRNEMLRQFSNLSELSLHHLDLDVILILLKLNKPLRKLELGNFDDTNPYNHPVQGPDMRNLDFAVFDELLAKHAATLESLKFVIPETRSRLDGRVIFQSIHFPVFPKLQFLTVGWLGIPFGWKKRFMEVEPEYGTFIFPDGRGSINYAKDLPVLKSLTLYPRGFNLKHHSNRTWVSRLCIEIDLIREESAGFYEMWFPTIFKVGQQEMEICKTVQRLDIFHQNKEWIMKSITFSERSMSVIAAMFPNVSNQWMNYIRSRVNLRLFAD